jgi:hypothetical protein
MISLENGLMALASPDGGSVEARTMLRQILGFHGEIVDGF